MVYKLQNRFYNWKQLILIWFRRPFTHTDIRILIQINGIEKRPMRVVLWMSICDARSDGWNVASDQRTTCLRPVALRQQPPYCSSLLKSCVWRKLHNNYNLRFTWNVNVDVKHWMSSCLYIHVDVLISRQIRSPCKRWNDRMNKHLIVLRAIQ